MKESLLRLKRPGIVEYKHEPRTVRTFGLLETSDLILKLYSMAKNLHPTERTLRDTKKFLTKELSDDEISPSFGLGFAILCEDTLNVSRWDDNHPIVLKNQLYGFEGSINSAKPLDIREAGTYCIWELGIVNYERDKWKEYLASHRGIADLSKYINSFLEGELK